MLITQTVYPRNIMPIIKAAAVRAETIKYCGCSVPPHSLTAILCASCFFFTDDKKMLPQIGCCTLYNIVYQLNYFHLTRNVSQSIPNAMPKTKSKIDNASVNTIQMYRKQFAFRKLTYRTPGNKELKKREIKFIKRDEKKTLRQRISY